jgi:hypothetical protein
MSSIAYVGPDVHKTTIAVAVAEGGRSGEVRQLGIYVNRADVLRAPSKHNGGQASITGGGAKAFKVGDGRGDGIQSR